MMAKQNVNLQEINVLENLPMAVIMKVKMKIFANLYQMKMTLINEF